MLERGGPRTLARMLEEAAEQQPGGAAPGLMTSAPAPSARFSARRFCGVCGFAAPYTCSRCGARYCCRRCYGIHSETRCLKFMA